MTQNWTHKVVKSQRGGDGKWFAHSTTTFGDEAAAVAFARSFAAEQRQAGVVGTRINVMSRRTVEGDFGPTNSVAEFVI